MTRYRLGNFIWSTKQPGVVTNRLGWSYRCVSCDALLRPGDGPVCDYCIDMAPEKLRPKMRANMLESRIPSKDAFITEGEEI